MCDTSLSKKGFTIKKSTLDKSDLKSTKKELTVKPFINEDYGMPAEPFPIYLENSNKLYVPKYYGIKKWSTQNYRK